MGCKHPVPYYFTDSIPRRGKNDYGHCDGVDLNREIFTELALETISVSLIMPFQLIKLKTFYMDDRYEYAPNV